MLGLLTVHPTNPLYFTDGSGKLHEAWKYCENFGVQNSLLVIRHGWIVGEWHNFTAPRGVASCTRSLTGLAMAKLLDLSDAGKLPRRINVDDEAWRFLPAKWVETEPARQRIRIHHLLTMTSGLTPYDGPYESDYEEKVFAQTVEEPPGTIRRLGPPGTFYQPMINRAGTWVTFWGRETGKQGSDIWIAATDGSRWQQLTFDGTTPVGRMP